MKKTIGFILSAMVLTSCGQPTSPGLEIFPDMMYAVPYEAYSQNPVTGTTNQLPPEGTVARGKLPYPYPDTPAGQAQAERELKNPVVASDWVMARGQKVFENYCLVCHGVKGEGDGPVIPKFPNPPSFMSSTLMNYTDGRIYHIIMTGGGGNIMPSYKEQIRESDRWALIHYIRKLQGKN